MLGNFLIKINLNVVIYIKWKNSLQRLELGKWMLVTKTGLSVFSALEQKQVFFFCLFVFSPELFKAQLNILKGENRLCISVLKREIRPQEKLFKAFPTQTQPRSVRSLHWYLNLKQISRTSSSSFTWRLLSSDHLWTSHKVPKFTICISLFPSGTAVPWVPLLWCFTTLADFGTRTQHWG